MNHYKKALEEGEKLFDEKFPDLPKTSNERGKIIHKSITSRRVKDIKSYLTSFAEKIRQAVAEDDVEWVKTQIGILTTRTDEEIRYVDGINTQEYINKLDFITHKREQLTKE